MHRLSYFCIVLSLFLAGALRAQSNAVWGSIVVKEKTKIWQGETLKSYCLQNENGDRYCEWYNAGGSKALFEKYKKDEVSWSEQTIFLRAGKSVYEKTYKISNTETVTEELIDIGARLVYKTILWDKSKQVRVSYYPQELQQAKTISCDENRMKSWLKDIDQVTFAGSKDKAGFHSTSFGLRIHDSCIQARGGAQKLVNEVTSSLVVGLNCLKKINTPKANDHRARLEMLFRGQSKPKLRCDAQKHSWSGVNAYATTNSKENSEHPQINFNPHTCSSWDSQDTKATFFHELFHNIGYLHGRDPEYAYTCAQCCFDESGDNALSCDLCGSEPSSSKDPKYLKKLVAQYNQSFSIYRPHEALAEALEKQPNNPDLLAIKIQLNSSIVAAHIGKAQLEVMGAKARKIDPDVRSAVETNLRFSHFEGLMPVARQLVGAEEAIKKQEYVKAKSLLTSIKYPASVPSKLKDSNEKIRYKYTLAETKTYQRDLLRKMADMAMQRQDYGEANKIYDMMDEIKR